MNEFDGMVIDGRPDFEGDRDFGVTYAKKHPPYVFSIRGSSALVHKVARVRLRWWIAIGSGEQLGKLNKPRMSAECVCGMFFRLEAKCSRTCRIPEPDALLCGRCHDEIATFGKHGAATKAGITRTVAHVKLGCVVSGYEATKT